MIGQAMYMKSSSPGPPFIDPFNSAPHASEVLAAFCSSSYNGAATTSTGGPAPPAPQPTSGVTEPRRLAKAPHPTHILKCPRCTSPDTKFCYYNNYSLSQPRYFCKNCKRYWTAGGVLRNVPVGGGLRKNKRSKLKLAAEDAAAAAAPDLSTQQRHHDQGKPPSPVQAVASPSAMGTSSITSVNSCIVTGLPAANFSGAVPSSVLPSTATPLPRTTSGSDCSTIDYAGSSESCTASGIGSGLTGAAAAAAAGSCQLLHLYQPQFLASYGTPALASSCNLQYSGSSSGVKGPRSIYNAVGYDGSCSQGLIVMEEVVGSNHDNDDVSNSHNVMMVGKGNHPSRKGEKEELSSFSSNYDWQFISENLYNGDGGFLHMPGGSWSDLLGLAEQ